MQTKETEKKNFEKKHSLEWGVFSFYFRSNCRKYIGWYFIFIIIMFGVYTLD